MLTLERGGGVIYREVGGEGVHGPRPNIMHAGTVRMIRMLVRMIRALGVRMIRVGVRMVRTFRRGRGRSGCPVLVRMSRSVRMILVGVRMIGL